MIYNDMTPNNLSEIKIYHIVHIDKLASIITDGRLYSDAIIHQRNVQNGTTIGMMGIKQRRLNTVLSSYPDLTVGGCVPFYFCPRSVMLYVIYRQNNPDLTYTGGQRDILHLELNLGKVLEWAKNNNKRCVFTTSNAGSNYFEDYNDFNLIYNKVNWDAVNATQWQSIKEQKQAEFLMESDINWSLVERIGVQNSTIYTNTSALINNTDKHKPILEIIPDWYY